MSALELEGCEKFAFDGFHRVLIGRFTLIALYFITYIIFDLLQ